MSLKSLIENQKIIIDDHKRGAGEIKNWDSQDADVHIDKTTNYRIKGKRQDVRIKIPINSERPLEVKSNRRLTEVPRKLKKEISQALENKDIRDDFIKDLLEILKSFDTILSTEKRARQVLEKLSKHFGLKWDQKKITTYVEDILEVYSESFLDEYDEVYFMTINKHQITIGQGKLNESQHSYFVRPLKF